MEKCMLWIITYFSNYCIYIECFVKKKIMTFKIEFIHIGLGKIIRKNELENERPVLIRLRELKY